jgi:hypothetical protein
MLDITTPNDFSRVVAGMLGHRAGDSASSSGIAGA